MILVALLHPFSVDYAKLKNTTVLINYSLNTFHPTIWNAKI